MSQIASRPVFAAASEGQLSERSIDRWLWAVPGVVAALMILPSIGAWCAWAPDSVTTYLPVARTLAHTWALPQHRLVAPPGYSLLLAPLLAIWGDTPLLMIRMLQGFGLVAIATMAFFIHRREFSKGAAATVAIIVAVNPVLLGLSMTALAEVVFTAAVCGWLLVMQRWQRRRCGPWTECAWVGVLCAAITLTRSIGALTIPISLWMLVRTAPARSLKLAAPLSAFLICSVGPLAAWELRQSSYPGSDSYRRAWLESRWDEPAGLRGPALYAHRLGSYGMMRLAALKETIVAPDPFWRLFAPPWSRAGSFILGGMLMAIALVRFVCYCRPGDALVLSMMGLLVFWPYDEGVRLVGPLIPILAAYPVWLIHRCLKSRPAAVTFAGYLLAFGLAGLYLPGVLRWEARIPGLREKETARFRQMHDLATWQAANLPADGDYVGVTPYRDNSKLLLAGASYLSGRSVRPIDCVPGQCLDVSPDSFDAAFVFQSLEAEAAERWAMQARIHAGPFAVFLSDSDEPNQ